MARTDWTGRDTVRPADMNQIGEDVNTAVTVANQAEQNANAYTDQHIIDYVKHPAFVVTENSENVYSVTVPDFPTTIPNGAGLVLAVNVSATGDTFVKINNGADIPIKKANGNAVSNLKQNGIYTMRYSVELSAFILQGEGGAGSAQPQHVLKGESFTNDEGEQVGTIPIMSSNTLPSTWDDANSRGSILVRLKISHYYPPYTEIYTQIMDSDLTTGNIASGVNIFGVEGSKWVINTFVSASYAADAAHIQEGKIAYVNGVKVIGTAPAPTS